MDGNENVSRLDFSFVAFGLKFGNSHANQSARDAADRCSDRRAAQGRKDGPRGDERSYAGDGKGANSREPAKHSAHNTAGTSPRGDTLGRFGVFFMREIPRGFLVREKNRDVVVGKSTVLKTSDNVLRLAAAGWD